MKKLPFQFYLLPESVWLDERISSGAKFLLAILLWYCDDDGWIEQTDKWYGTKMRVEEQEVRSRIKELIDAGYAERSKDYPNRLKINIGIYC